VKKAAAGSGSDADKKAGDPREPPAFIIMLNRFEY